MPTAVAKKLETISREQLENVLKTLAGAVASKDEVPELAAVFFDGERVKAYDDVLAISVPGEYDFKGGVNHKLLSAWVNGVSGSDIEVETSDKQISFRCGRSHITLELLDWKRYAFQRTGKSHSVLTQSDALMRILRVCAQCMITHDSRAWSSGVTLSYELTEGTPNHFSRLRGYSTNDRVFATAEELDIEGESNFDIGLPETFVRECLRTESTRNLEAFRVGSEWVCAEFDDGTQVYCRTLSDLDIAKYEGLLEKLGEEREFADVPEELPEAMKRAAFIARTTKANSVRLEINKGELTLSSESVAAASADTIKCGKHKHVVAFIPSDSTVFDMLEGMKRFSVRQGDMAFYGVGCEVYVSAATQD